MVARVGGRAHVVGRTAGRPGTLLRRCPGRSRWAPLVVALLTPAAAVAQRLDIEAGTGIIRSGPATTAAAAILAPTLAIGGGDSILQLGGQLAGLATGGVAAELSGTGAWSHAVGDGIGLAARLEGRWSALPAAVDVGEARVMLGIRLGGPNRGASAEIGVARYRAPTGPQTAPQGEIVIWSVLGRLRLRASAAMSAFREPLTAPQEPVVEPPDSALSSEPPVARTMRLRRYTDAELGAEWRPGRLELHLAWGVRMRDAASVAESWGRAAASYVLRDGLALTAAAGVMPANIERGLRRAPFGRIGLRFDVSAAGSGVPPIPAPPGTPALQVRNASDGYVVLLARVPGARRVEVKGDFTDWQPVELSAAGPDLWQAHLRVAPGIHRVNLRVDGGAWMVPPGLPSVLDEFGGMVGLLVVE